MALPKHMTRLATKTVTKGKVGEIFAGIDMQNLGTLIPCRFFYNIPALARGGGNDAQIDFVLLTLKGFFTVEVKNWYCSKLYIGGEDASFWEAEYHGKMKQTQNPFRQNKWHRNRLKAATGSNYESLVLFTNSCRLVNNTRMANVMYISNLIAYILSLPDIYTEKQMKEESYKILELKEEGRYR